LALSSLLTTLVEDNHLLVTGIFHLSCWVHTTLFSKESAVFLREIMILTNDVDDTTCGLADDMGTNITSSALLTLGFKVLGICGWGLVNTKAYNTGDLVILMSWGDQVLNEVFSVRFGFTEKMLALKIKDGGN